MRATPRAIRGAVTSPHHLASQAGLAVLRDGGNAIEACVAAAATIAVVYPHMNNIGGDAFWLIADGNRDIHAIDASGRGGGNITAARYREAGLDAVPLRGPMAACTVAGTISGWATALKRAKAWGGKLPLSRLLEDAIHYARNGAPAAEDLANSTADAEAPLLGAPGFAEQFRPGGKALAHGQVLKQPELAASLELLVQNGLDDFYRGELATALGEGFDKAGMLLTRDDLAAHQAVETEPLSLKISAGTLYNMPAPTQGMTSLMILGAYDRIAAGEAESFDHHHRLIEATKHAYIVRNREIGDPAHLKTPQATFLTDGYLDEMAAGIDRARASEWSWPHKIGDTIWLATMDGEGRGVSFIQSLYYSFGSGVVVPGTGIVWQNRGAGFSMDEGAVNAIGPGRKPFHTLNPALAKLDDGRLLIYGTRGGDGQPQIQAQVFSRHVHHGMPLQHALDAPRWSLGRTQVHDDDYDLLLENRFDPALVEALEKAGHAVQMTGPLDSTMGHAGALSMLPTGVIEGASEPRSDGAVAAF